jgi:phage-related protein
MMDFVPEKPRNVVWLVDTLDRLKGFPAGVREKLGFALYQAQIGQKYENTKPLHGFDAPLWEARADDLSGTYRAVYLVQYRNAVYVLHVFQKKAKSGIATPQREIELIRQRLKLARKLAGPPGD